MKYLFVINRHSGKANFAKQLEKEISLACRKYDLQYEIYLTKAKDDALHFCKAKAALANKDNPLRIYACGGDGLLNEIANGIYGFAHVSLGCLPHGTGNDFVRNFGKAKDFLDIEGQLFGSSTDIDVMLANNRVCINMINIGFDCMCAKNVDKYRNGLIKIPSLSFYRSVLHCLAEYPKINCTVTLEDGTSLSRKFLLVALGNGCFCGGGFMAASKASLYDGLCDIVCIADINRLTFLKNVLRYKNGTLIGSGKEKAFVSFFKAKKLEITSPSAFDISIDGEIVGVSALCLEVIPKAMRFILPAAVSHKSNNNQKPQESCPTAYI